MACTAHVVRASYHCTEERLKKQEKELKKKRRAEEEARRKAEEARTRAEAMANASYITPMHDSEIIGKLVEIHSLKHDKYAKLNGCKGRIQGAQGTRWLVHIFNLKTTKAVKAENLFGSRVVQNYSHALQLRSERNDPALWSPWTIPTETGRVEGHPQASFFEKDARLLGPERL